MRWDIFCKVIDNHGDLGVCWRLSAELAARGDAVRLWVDDPSALSWMAPGGREGGCKGVQVLPWDPYAADPAPEPGDAVIEAFGCDPHPAFQAAIAQAARTRGQQPAWINLEYLSAESYVERCHGLASPVLSGPAAGLSKRFFYPGFTARTGGLLREQDLDARRAVFDRAAWLASHGLPARGERRVSLFCYEPPMLGAWVERWRNGPKPTRLLVTPGRARAALEAALTPGAPAGNLSITYLPYLTQTDYDHLLWACDLNFVRGEDSLVRALWAGRPFVWQIYPQEDGAHHAKLDAFLEWLGAPPEWRALHRAWNGNVPQGPLIDPPDGSFAPDGAIRALRRNHDLIGQLRAMADPAGWRPCEPA
ncbi:MAG: hypothetical protein RIS88_2973 [Pseudomonadota bacterium]|jgi:uncharacterized repeat protein (TIGR03837 family)